MTEETNKKLLTPAQATAVVKNGGLVWYEGTPALTGWLDGELLAYWPSYRVGVGFDGSPPYTYPKLPHPLYDPAVFALTFPLTLSGPEAKALLMKAPVGMLRGCNTAFKGDFGNGSEYWDGAKFDGHCMQVRWHWRDNETYEIRLRPGWLESQRAKFARGEFGETGTCPARFIETLQAAQKATRDHSIHFGPKKEPVMNRYIINGKPYKFPWQGSGPECVEIWTHAPKGMLEWDTAPILLWKQHCPAGDAHVPYHLRLRSDAPKPGDVVDATRAWELCMAGWVMVYNLFESEIGLVNGTVRHIVDGKFDMESFSGRMRLRRHEPWRCATLETGYCWSEQDAAQALRAGMEGRLQNFCWNLWARADAHEGKIIGNDGIMIEEATAEEYARDHNNWALRWPEDNAEMEAKDETLTAGQALDALIAGERLTGCCSATWEKGHTRSGITLDTFISNTPFRRVPKRPVSQFMILDNGINVEVYADRVEYSVPGCGIWKISKQKCELALHMEGWIGEGIWVFAIKEDGSEAAAGIHDGYVLCSSRKAAFTDIRRVLAAMRELGGGE